MKKILVLFVSLFVSCIIYAQDQYIKDGKRYVTQGNYIAAKEQFEAARAMYDAKKVNKNSSEYIEVEKLISRATDCVDYSRTLNNILKQRLSDSQIQQAFASCTTEEEADTKMSALNNYCNQAESAAQRIISAFSTDASTKAAKASIDGIRQRIVQFKDNFPDIMAWQKIANSSSSIAFENYISEFPNGLYVSAANEKLNSLYESAAWEDISQAVTYSGLKKFLSDFPDGAHHQEAMDLFVDVEENYYWSEAKDKGTRVALNAYLNKYPKGKYVSEVNQMMSNVEENEYWQKRLSENTVAAYDQYLKKYPNGRFVSTATTNKNKIEDSKLWETALATNTIEGYNKYLSSSRTKVYAAEADARISQIKQQQAIAADNANWNRIKNSQNPGDFMNYASGTGLVQHKNEALYMYNALSARAIDLDYPTAASVVQYLTAAQKYQKLTSADNELLAMAKDHDLFNTFYRRPSLSAAKEYIAAYPSGMYSVHVSNYIAKTLMDQANHTITASQFNEISSYVKDKETAAYINDKYNRLVEEHELILRRAKFEPLHLLLGVEVGGSNLAGTDVDGNAYSSYTQPSVGLALSFGGHSNLLNLEVGCDTYYGAFVRPKLNLFKKYYDGDKSIAKRYGSEYSAGYFYIAPEVYYSLPDIIPNPFEDQLIQSDLYVDGGPLNYGAKLGFGIGMFDFSIGYLMPINTIKFGMTFYLGRK